MGATPRGLGWSESRIVVVVGGSLLMAAWLAAFVIMAMTDGEWELGPWVPMPGQARRRRLAEWHGVDDCGHRGRR